MRQGPVGQQAVKVVATQGRVTARRHDFKHTFTQAQQGHIECPAAQVIDEVEPFRAVLQTVGNGGGRGLVDQAQHVNTRQFGRVFGGLALCVVKVSGHGDHGTKQVVVKTVFGALAQGGQNFCGHFNR